MFDPKLYREACRELRAPEDKIEEIIAMTEKTNKKRIRPLRTALIAVAAVAMMVVSVAAANPEGAEELWYRVMDIVHIGQYRSEVVGENGEHMTLMSIPEATVENQDGRAVLVIAGEQTIDITDALDSDGRYVYEDTDEGTHLVITVTGTIDNWELTVQLGKLGEEPMASYTNSSNPGTKEIYDEDGEHLFTVQNSSLDDENTAAFIIQDEDLDGEVSTGFYTTASEFPQP